jgi:hypothetical protein
MENLSELSPRELLGLKDVQLKRRSADRALALQLINDDLIVGSPDGYLKLTAKGRWCGVRRHCGIWYRECRLAFKINLLAHTLVCSWPFGHFKPPGDVGF